MSTLHIQIAGRTHKVVLAPDAPAEVDGHPIPASIQLLAPGVLSLLLTLPNGATRSFRCIADGDEAVLIDGARIPYTLADPRSLRALTSSTADTGPKPLKSPMPGRIVRVLIANGQEVTAGQGCVVIEAMKMQNELKAPKAGTIARLTAAVGETVPSGATLLIVE